MPVIETKALVLGTLKYGDTSLIVKCFTYREGVKSYLLRGVLKSKKGKLKPAYFQPLNHLQILANHNTKGTLNSIKEVQIAHAYETIPVSIVKQTIIMFLSEVLSSIIKEEEQNIQLYNYLETGLLWLDTHDNVSNFHLLFLLNLSRYLGFYPDVNEQDKLYFNLLRASFSDIPYEKFNLKEHELILFKRLLGINFDGIDKVLFSKDERQIVLKLIIQYFELHLEGFKKPRSLNVLETVFS